MSDPVRRDAVMIREEWLGAALSTLPADRPAAEAAISGLYELAGLGPPRFHWVSSPAVAVHTIPPGARRRPPETYDRLSGWVVPERLVALARQRGPEIHERATALRPGLGEFHQQVKDPLWQTYAATLQLVRQAAHDPPRLDPWYRLLAPDWLAHDDALRRAGHANLTPRQDRWLDLWAAVMRSCGPWWPRQDVCVVAERPAEIHTEGADGGLRLHHADGPAVRYPDGWEVHAWHGRRVPAWVIGDPSVERIEREADTGVRRCAIERLGWPVYVEQAGLPLVAAAPDPGEPGAELRLYDLDRRTRVLLAVGAAPGYALVVPGSITDPVAAAGWTFGLSADAYSRLARRT